MFGLMLQSFCNFPSLFDLVVLSTVVISHVAGVLQLLVSFKEYAGAMVIGE